MTHSNTSEQELWHFIEETEQFTGYLKEELRKEQLHQAIDNLPELLEQTRGKWSNLGLLLEQIITETKNRKKEQD